MSIFDVAVYSSIIDLKDQEILDILFVFTLGMYSETLDMVLPTKIVPGSLVQKIYVTGKTDKSYFYLAVVVLNVDVTTIK